MFKSRPQPQITCCPKVAARVKPAATARQVSPFSGESATDGQSAIISPKSGPQLPTGVRYIHQQPNGSQRSVAGRRTPTEQSKLRQRSVSRDRGATASRSTSATRSTSASRGRDKSPEKAVRFGDLKNGQTIDTLDSKTQTATKAKTVATDNRSRLNRPVIPPETTTTARRTPVTKTALTSPATRQTSPIFSINPFDTETKRTNDMNPSPLVNPMAIDSPLRSQSSASSAASTPETRPALDRQHIVKARITTPGGTVRRAAAVMTKANTNGVHKSNLTFPVHSTRDRRSDRSRPSDVKINVNVAVGLEHNPYPGYDEQLSDDEVVRSEGIPSSEDEVDWQSVARSGDGFALNVAVRLRPFLQQEISTKNDKSVIDMNGSTVRIVNSDNDNYNRTEYGFDVCLNSADKDLFEFADQGRVFQKMGEPLLERALEGYNVCLFAYGQTGSGKSFTMMGSEANPGIIPRFVHELYRRMSSLPDVYFAVEVSYYEIYNEKIYDLLSDDKNQNKKILRIREHPQTGPYVENLSQHTADSYDEVMTFLRLGGKRRATASTAANQDSSRSHSIFTLILSQLRQSEDLSMDVSCSCGSRINLIDLAGSERHNGAANGDRLKEGSMINKSLLNLGKVIAKLADLSQHPTRRGHVPYRDSPLTWLLRESLGGNSQTSMIATISPAKCHLEETISTLRYASTARRIVNYVHINEDPKNKKIRELMAIIADLKARQREVSPTPVDEVIPQPKTSQHAFTEPKVIEKKHIATSTTQLVTPQMTDRRTSTSSLNFRRTSFKSTGTEPIPEEPKKKTTTCVATNTSMNVFPSKPKSQHVSTSPMKSPKGRPCTASTGTDTHVKHVDSGTSTVPLDLVNLKDLNKADNLGKDWDQLHDEMMRFKQKLTLAKAKYDGEVSYPAPTSDNDQYYSDCLEIESVSSFNSNQTYTLQQDSGPGVDETDDKDTDEWGDAENGAGGQDGGQWAADTGAPKDDQTWDEEPTPTTSTAGDWSEEPPTTSTAGDWSKEASNEPNTGGDNEWGSDGSAHEKDRSQESQDVSWTKPKETDDQWSSDTKTDEQTKDSAADQDWAADDNNGGEWGTTGDDENNAEESNIGDNKTTEDWGPTDDNKDQDWATTGDNAAQESGATEDNNGGDWGTTGDDENNAEESNTGGDDQWGAEGGQQSGATADGQWGAENNDQWGDGTETQAKTEDTGNEWTGDDQQWDQNEEQQWDNEPTDESPGFDWGTDSSNQTVIVKEEKKDPPADDDW